MQRIFDERNLLFACLSVCLACPPQRLFFLRQRGLCSFDFLSLLCQLFLLLNVVVSQILLFFGRLFQRLLLASVSSHVSVDIAFFLEQQQRRQQQAGWVSCGRSSSSSSSLEQATALPLLLLVGAVPELPLASKHSNPLGREAGLLQWQRNARGGLCLSCRPSNISPDMLEDYVGQAVSVYTFDGRHLVGILEGFDSKIDVVLAACYERFYSTVADQPAQIDTIGLHIVRGDNIAIVGLLLDEALFDASGTQPGAKAGIAFPSFSHSHSQQQQ